MKLGNFVLLLAVTLAFMVGEAAAGTFRCNGKVQFRPCGHPVADGKLAFEKVTLPRLQIKQIRPETVKAPERASLSIARPAIIEVKSFERVGKRDGLWRGFVTGKGNVRLNLKFAKSGRIQEERAVGQIYLSRYKTTTFTVRTALPKGRNLTWHIEAFQDIA